MSKRVFAVEMLDVPVLGPGTFNRITILNKGMKKLGMKGAKNRYEVESS